MEQGSGLGESGVPTHDVPMFHVGITFKPSDPRAVLSPGLARLAP